MWENIFGVFFVCTTEEILNFFIAKDLTGNITILLPALYILGKYLGKAECLTVCKSKTVVLQMAEKLGV